ncbi:amino acid deaminase/aldolase [Veronia nyctiphanis]|nr:amino acid deaminase/aldolase [Veronia nyctiphanis]
MKKVARDYAFYRSLFKDTEKPFAYVDLDLFDANANALKGRAGDKKIRIASKSVRCPSLIKRLLDSDSQFQGIMSFHPDEAVYLSQQGFDDILMGYPICHPQKIRAMGMEIKRGKRLILMIDSPEHVALIDAIGQELNVTFPVCLDVDMSTRFPFLHFGVRRSGVTTPESALPIYYATKASTSVRLVGVMGYEAQIAGLADNVPGQGARNWLIRKLKARSVKDVAERRANIIKTLEEQGAELELVNGGGTGSLESTIKEAVVTEVTVGSGFYSSALFDDYLAFKHQPAAGFAIEVVRQPTQNIYTCLGGGYIASGQTGTDKQPKPYLPHGLSLSQSEGTGEVQTPITYTGAEALEFGAPIFFRHSKAGELCERFNHVHLIKDDKLAGITSTYRGEGQCFL